MKFKVVKGTATFDNLMELKAKMCLVYKEAKKVVRELGGTGHCSDHNAAWGGVDAIEFAERPAGWKIMGKAWQRLYYPKASERELCKKLSALPTVSHKEINEIVKFNAPQTVCNDAGMYFVNCVGLTWGKDYVLMEVTEGAKYKAPKDVVEILDSEFQKLKERAGKVKDYAQAVHDWHSADVNGLWKTAIDSM